MVLETRDIEDSATIFGFPVSNHKKVLGFLKIFIHFLFFSKKCGGGLKKGEGAWGYHQKYHLVATQ